MIKNRSYRLLLTSILKRVKRYLEVERKALGTGGGSYDAAPSTLTGGAVLMTESIEKEPHSTNASKKKKKRKKE